MRRVIVPAIAGTVLVAATWGLATTPSGPVAPPAPEVVEAPTTLPVGLDRGCDPPAAAQREQQAT